jgi:hypothetical protein
MNLLAQSWGGTVADTLMRVERTAVAALTAADGSLEGTRQPQRQLAEFELRDPRMTDDGPLRSHQAQSLHGHELPESTNFRLSDVNQFTSVGSYRPLLRL